MDNYIEAYQNIIDICKKFIPEKTTRSRDPEEYMNRIKNIAENQKCIHDFNQKYGLNIPYDVIFSMEYVKVNDHISIEYFKDGYEGKEKGLGRYISRSSDGKQPVNERLMCIRFSTGAYIFGSDYPEKTFDNFFQELRAFGAKYTDSANNCLYFSLENAGDIMNKYQALFNIYSQQAKEEIKEIKRKQLEDQLQKLQ